MKISTKGRYALRMLLDLAEHREDGFIPLRDIAERQNISKKYLEQIVLLLQQSGLLRSERGFQGGYQLAIDPEDCSAGQVLRLTEGNLAPVVCLETEENLCPRCDACKTLPLWQGLEKTIVDYLDHVSLADLLHKSDSQLPTAEPCPAPFACQEK